MPFPLSIHAQEKQRARTGLVVLASSFLFAVALLAFLNEYSEPAIQIDVLQLKDGFTVSQIGQYGMRADRQARNFEQGDTLCEAARLISVTSHRDSHFFLQMRSAALTKQPPCAPRAPMPTLLLLNSSKTRARAHFLLRTRKTKSRNSSVRNCVIFSVIACSRMMDCFVN